MQLQITCERQQLLSDLCKLYPARLGCCVLCVCLVQMWPAEKQWMSDEKKQQQQLWGVRTGKSGRKSESGWLLYERTASLLSCHLTSSSRIICGAFRMVLAIATLCFSPPLSFRPLSPTWVSYPARTNHQEMVRQVWKTVTEMFRAQVISTLPSGNAMILSCMSAASAASSTSWSLALMRPYRMLFWIVSLKRTVSWGTTPMWARTDICFTWGKMTQSSSGCICQHAQQLLH